ncbi:MAG: hypothetical protein ACR2PA_19500 [Hyphomicrobiaceae bacterium]
MAFDPKFKELARGRDAVDRLHDLKGRLAEQHELRARITDTLLRLVIFALTAGLVAYAAWKL